MRRVVMRGVVARKLRLFALAFVVFLGVAAISGGYVLTDTINASFSDIFSESLKGTDVTVNPREPEGNQGDLELPAFPASLEDRIRDVEGVEAAAGGIFTPGRFVDEKGDPIGNEFAPNFISSTQPERFEALNYVEGRVPRSAGEAALDASTADSADLGIGGSLRIASEEEVTEYRIVGLVKLGETSFGGAAIAQLTLEEAQRITGKAGKYDQISIAAGEGVTPKELEQRVRRVMPASVRVETGTESATRQSEDIASDLGFFNVVLTVASGVLLFVGGFLIFNTFSITVAQRTRELGLLRTLGATRRQVLVSVVAEALVIGVLASVLGLGGGLLIAEGLGALFRSFGVDLPNTGTVFAARTAVLGLSVGIGITLVAALSPALRATRVSPMAALRDAEVGGTGQRPGRKRLALAGLLALGGLVLSVMGITSDSGGSSATALVGFGAVAMLMGVALLSPVLVKPLAAVAGWPMERLTGLTGRLARENALRKPGRTASTAAALMIGLALVVFVTVFGAGISASVGKAIDDNFRGDLVLQNTDGFSQISAKAPVAAAEVEGVQTVSSLSFAAGSMREPVRKTVRLTGAEPSTASETLALDWKEGSAETLSGLGPNDAVMDDATARDVGLEVGDQMAVRTSLGKTATYTVRGIAEDRADLLGDALVDVESLRTLFGTRGPSFTFVKVAGGQDVGAVQERVTQALADRYPTVEVFNNQELKEEQERQIGQLVGMFYALLALAVIVSVMGIAITLMLSIHERTRELGLLRAVGMSRRQVRRTMRYEAVITALIGAVLGTFMGVVFAALVSRPLADQGFELAYPIGTLLILLVVAAVAGVVAAIYPARRAARLDVLKALAYE